MKNKAKKVEMRERKREFRNRIARVICSNGIERIEVPKKECEKCPAICGCFDKADKIISLFKEVPEKEIAKEIVKHYGYTDVDQNELAKSLKRKFKIFKK